jgi:hypothetical protein
MILTEHGKAAAWAKYSTNHPFAAFHNLLLSVSMEGLMVTVPITQE